jgi:hypothetical protein
MHDHTILIKLTLIYLAKEFSVLCNLMVDNHADTRLPLTYVITQFNAHHSSATATYSLPELISVKHTM